MYFLLLLCSFQEGEEEKNVDPPKQVKPEKGQIKSKNEKSSGPKHIPSMGVNKNKDGKDTEQTAALLNGSGTGASHPHPKLPPNKSRSFNDRQAQVPKVIVSAYCLLASMPWNLQGCSFDYLFF